MNIPARPRLCRSSLPFARLLAAALLVQAPISAWNPSAGPPLCFSLTYLPTYLPYTSLLASLFFPAEYRNTSRYSVAEAIKGKGPRRGPRGQGQYERVNAARGRSQKAPVGWCPSLASSRKFLADEHFTGDCCCGAPRDTGRPKSTARLETRPERRIRGIKARDYANDVA